jgi:hypothetical protein
MEPNRDDIIDDDFVYNLGLRPIFDANGVLIDLEDYDIENEDVGMFSEDSIPGIINELGEVDLALQTH